MAFRNCETRAITEVIGGPSSPKLRKALLRLNCAAAFSASSGEVRSAIDRALAETKARAAERESAAKERQDVGGWAAARQALH